MLLENQNETVYRTKGFQQPPNPSGLSLICWAILDLNLAATYCNRIHLLKSGKIVAYGKRE